MSHTLYQPVASRVQRSELAVPGSNTTMIEKAADSAADFIFFGLGRRRSARGQRTSPKEYH